jgi:hypothetical protein
MVSVRGDSALGIVVAIIVLAVLIWNVTYIGGVRRELASGSNLNLSKTAADIIFGIDIALILLVGIYLIYNIFIIITTNEQRAAIQQKVTETATKPRAGALPIVRRTVNPQAIETRESNEERTGLFSTGTVQA